MGLKEFFGGFDPHSYAVSIKDLRESELREEHAIIRQRKITAKTGTGLGVAGALHTGGVSLVASGINLRRWDLFDQKLSIIENRMESEGWSPSRLRGRDLLMAVGPIAAVQAVAPGAEHVVGSFIIDAAGHGAATYAAHHTAHVASSALHHPAAFAHAAEDGVKAQVAAIGHGLEGHATQLVSTKSIADDTTAFLGSTAGQAAASALELGAAHQIVRYGARKGIEAYLRARVANSGNVNARKGFVLEHVVDKRRVTRVGTTDRNKNIFKDYEERERSMEKRRKAYFGVIVLIMIILSLVLLLAGKRSLWSMWRSKEGVLA